MQRRSLLSARDLHCLPLDRVSLLHRRPRLAHVRRPPRPKPTLRKPLHFLHRLHRLRVARHELLGHQPGELRWSRPQRSRQCRLNRAAESCLLSGPEHPPSATSCSWPVAVLTPSVGFVQSARRAPCCPSRPSHARRCCVIVTCGSRRFLQAHAFPCCCR
ncbi:uncharacterized protein K452DRAFT_87790 [Aplosporella prunicola CBS 121167]|uniref:Uncharacterized protein n=1 Tax=Aplosporella prunicola CBS 121167 TaxID=1176127 RepID=A0A6A6B6D0_9PEZI|nr:uncharacterized protein K452DRAFT_87790 [Aplosporella prunicola CBS 121167]KAF2138527.1 hypothetical protein K452DRAFT_87790 [Aplosporella prunicola CBS 121167]